MRQFSYAHPYIDARQLRQLYNILRYPVIMNSLSFCHSSSSAYDIVRLFGNETSSSMLSSLLLRFIVDPLLFDSVVSRCRRLLDISGLPFRYRAGWRCRSTSKSDLWHVGAVTNVYDIPNSSQASAQVRVLNEQTVL